MSASWQEQVIYEVTGSHPFSQDSGSQPLLWGALKIDFRTTANHNPSMRTKVNVDLQTIQGPTDCWFADYRW